ERDGLAAALAGRDRPCPATALAGAVGVPEAASGLFAVAGAVVALTRGAAPPLVGGPPPAGGSLEWVGPAARPGRYERVLVAGGTDAGNCAALVLSRREDEP